MHNMVWESLVLPVPAVDMGPAQVDIPVVKPDHSSFFNEENFPKKTSTQEKRVLRILQALHAELQEIIGAGGVHMHGPGTLTGMFTLLAAKTATLRTCGVRQGKIDILLAPILEVTSLLRRRTGVPPITDARRAYLLGQVFQRADALENIIAQALWVEAWPTVPAELGAAIKPDLAKETETRADKALRSSAIHCGPRRRASAKTNPRSSHLRGSGAVVVA